MEPAAKPSGTTKASNNEWESYHLSAAERNSILLSFVELYPTTQNALDSILSGLVKRDPVAFMRLKKDVEEERDLKTLSSRSRRRSPSLGSSAANGTLTITGQFRLDKKKQEGSNVLEFKTVPILVEDYKQFWFHDVRKDELATDEKTVKDVLEVKMLASYVPKLVVRRLCSASKLQAIKPPEIENYPACVVFADISGFTPLTEKLAKMGKQGIEKLTTVLNSYFGGLIRTILKHAGDIVKFAGDALLVQWPTHSRKGLSDMISLACQCAKSLISDLGNYEVPGTGCTLKLHIGVGAGEVTGIHIGGCNDQSEFFISGQVLEQVSSCEKQAAPGEIFVSAIAWMLVEPGRLVGTQKGKEAFSNYKLEAVEIPAELPPEDALPLFPEMRAQLQQYLQPAVLRHIELGSTGWLAELRSVSVIFLNLTTPFKLHQLSELQTAFTRMQDIIYKYEGVVRQFMIDDKGSVLIGMILSCLHSNLKAGFGLPPLSHEDDPIRAVETALELYSCLRGLKIPCSIGITTGKAFCGDVGSTERREYAMIGDIVNLSARLMIAARTYILCDIDTFEASKGSKNLRFKRLEDIMVKGKSTPIAVFQPLLASKRDLFSAKEEKQGSTVKIVGRLSELKQINEMITSFNTNRSTSLKRQSNPGILSNDIRNNILIVSGAEGVGKTCIVEQSLFQQTNAPIFTGYADPLRSTTQYYAWKDIFSVLLDKNGNLPSSLLEELGNSAPLLTAVLPLDIPPTDYTTSLSGQERSEATQLLLVSLLDKIATPGSLIILENTQWMDSSSWSLLLGACQQIDQIFVVLTLRTMKTPSVQYTQIRRLPNTTYMELRNFSLDESSECIGNILRLKKVPDRLTKEIFLKGQGNPFLTIEIISAIRDSGSLHVTKGGECIMTEETEASLRGVPGSVAGLLTSKVDKLTPSQQTLLKVASIIGNIFPVKVLSAIMSDETISTQLNKDLAILSRLNFIMLESPNPNLAYSFANTLLRDVVYDLMLFSQRKQIHQSLADYYRREYQGVQSYYPLLAYHCREAELDEEAMQYYTKAGSQSLFVYANKEATTFFTEAIVLATKLKKISALEGISLERKLGTAYYNLGDFDKADEHLRKAAELLGITVPSKERKRRNSEAAKPKKSTTSSPTLEASEVAHRKREGVIVLLSLAKANYYSCAKSIALFCAALGLQMAQDVGAALLGEAYAINCVLCAANEDFETASSYFTKGLDQAGSQLDVKKIVYQMGGMMYTCTGDWTKATDCLNKALDAAKTVGDKKSLEQSMIFLAMVYYFNGSLQESTRILTEASQAARLRGDIQIEIYSETALARNYLAVGENELCLKSLSSIAVGLESLGTTDIGAEIEYYALVALFCFRLNEIEDCWEIANVALSLSKNIEPTLYACLPEVFLLLSQQPKLLTEKITRSKALSKAEKAIALLSKYAKPFSFAQPREMLWSGVLNQCNGKNSKAEKDWSKAIELVKSLNMPYEEALIYYEKGIFGLHASDLVKAVEIFPEIKTRAKHLKELKDKMDTKSITELLTTKNFIKQNNKKHLSLLRPKDFSASLPELRDKIKS